MTTAKVKLKNKDLAEAEKYLKMELQQNPANDEAKVLLIETLFMQNKSDEAINYMSEVSGSIKDPKMQQQFNQLSNRIWVDAYNAGIRYYNKYLQSNDEAYIDTAIASFNNGLILRPQMVDFHSFKGMMLEMRGDTVEAMEEYQMYLNKLKPEFEYATKKGLFLGMTDSQLKKVLGDAATSNGMRSNNGDSLLVQKFTGDGELMAYYSAKGNDDLKLQGWRYNLPDSWSENEKMNIFTLDLAPIINLSQYNYSNGNKDKSLKFIKVVADIDPNNDQVNSFMISLYQELDRIDEAIASVQALVDKNPNNKVYWTKFGDLYINLGLSDEDLSDDKKLEYFNNSVKYYEKALEIDPNYDNAVRNMGSAYINLASVVQSQEMAKADEDDTYEPKLERYEPYLKKAVEYLTKALKSDAWKDDFKTWNELANIYMVLGQENDLKQVVRQMEALEYSITERYRKEQYYLNLLKIYSEMKESEKMREIQKKLEDLK
jgi:tetratricopeptide (TPR) repeat protein